MSISSADITLLGSTTGPLSAANCPDVARPDTGIGAVVPVDPLTFPDWDSLLAANDPSSFFHGRAWASVLHETYGHRPFYFCRLAGQRLEALLATMEVSSWCTGRRGVSLPFTDECPVFSSSPDSALYQAALGLGRARGWRYLECRGNSAHWPGAKPSVSFYTHVIDLQGGPEILFKRLASSLRRGIRKAQDEGLNIQFESRPEAISLYYSLHCMTRRRHGVPPQPFRFFENIGRRILGAGQGFVAIARLGKEPVAAAVFFRGSRQAIYKFGASDYRFQQLRPNNLLMWEAMKHCAEAGCASLHMGRTSLSNEGLRRFKLSFGAREETATYAKYDLKREAFVGDVDRAEGPLNRVFRSLPAPLFQLAGRVLYPHLS